MSNQNRFCRCKDCKKAKRRGLVLGSKWAGSFVHGFGRVSAYVPYHRWQKGRRPEDKGCILTEE